METESLQLHICYTKAAFGWIFMRKGDFFFFSVSIDPLFSFIFLGSCPSQLVLFESNNFEIILFYFMQSMVLSRFELMGEPI